MGEQTRADRAARARLADCLSPSQHPESVKGWCRVDPDLLVALFNHIKHTNELQECLALTELVTQQSQPSQPSPAKRGE